MMRDEHNTIITVNKDDVLKKIRANREQHREKYALAMAKYTDIIRQRAEELVQGINAGKELPELNHVFNPVRPRSYLNDYDTIIQMLEMSVKDQLEISKRQFQSYVMDDWDWKDLFIGSTAQYV